MGYQRLDLSLDDGRVLNDVPAFNAEEVELPDEFAQNRIRTSDCTSPPARSSGDISNGV